jgi:isoquinoline 1-oxidoreductase alpha subunit
MSWPFGQRAPKPLTRLSPRRTVFNNAAQARHGRTGDARMIRLHVNGTTHMVDAEGETPLLWVIRDNLAMTGTKYGCGIAQCGACSVMIDGAVTRSCVTTVDQVIGKAITTIEAIEQDPVGHRVVEAWVRHQVPQCGYCQSGQVMAATALLKAKPHPADDDINAAMTNLCRCGTYRTIRAAVHDVAGEMA